jgi:hypothetical protein
VIARPRCRRADRHQPVAGGAAGLGAELALEHFGHRPAQGLFGRHARDPLGGRVPEDDLLVAVDCDDPVGDVAEDGDAALALERDLLVELGLREGDRGVRASAASASISSSCQCAAGGRSTASTPWSSPSAPKSGTARYAA